MKSFFLLLIATGSVWSIKAGTKLEDFSPHLSTNALLIWNISSNSVPQHFWIYRRHGLRMFSQKVISNAIVLASLESKGFPKASANDFFIWEDRGPNYPGGIPSIFAIQPKAASISYWMPHSNTGSSSEIPKDGIIISRAWVEAYRLGMDTNQLRFKCLTSRFRRVDEHGRDITNVLCGRSVFLSRELDGILFLGLDDAEGNEGFTLELGSHGKVRSFSLIWPELDRYQNQEAATREQLAQCIWGRRVLVLPNNEEKYFQRLKNLVAAKRFTITRITPYYGEGAFGEEPKDDSPSQFITPFAELEAVADFGTSNTAVRVLSPVLSSDVKRLLSTNSARSDLQERSNKRD